MGFAPHDLLDMSQATCPLYNLKSGSPGWDRTNDLAVNSRSLLPLSYRGFLLYGGHDRIRTCNYKILNLTRLPIAPRAHFISAIKLTYSAYSQARVHAYIEDSRILKSSLSLASGPLPPSHHYVNLLDRVCYMRRWRYLLS